MTMEERLAQALHERYSLACFHDAAGNDCEVDAAALLDAPSLRGLRELVEAATQTRDIDLWMDAHMGSDTPANEWEAKYREYHDSGIALRDAVDVFRGAISPEAPKP